MFNSKIVNFALIFLLSVSGALAASGKIDPADGDGTEEHPEIKRFPGFFIDGSTYNDFNEFSFMVRGPGSAGLLKAGKFWHVDYILKDGERKPSGLELVKNFENEFKRNGGRMVARNESGAVFSIQRPSLERWLQLEVLGNGDRYKITIVDAASMEQKLELTAHAMYEQMLSSGRVSIKNIEFEIGSSNIRAESSKILEEVSLMMREHPEMKIEIEGHTDNLGSGAVNGPLSRSRAESVASWLVKSGIAGHRITASGYGSTRPVADNSSAEGRANNRRVEFVRR